MIAQMTRNPTPEVTEKVGSSGGDCLVQVRWSSEWEAQGLCDLVYRLGYPECDLQFSSFLRVAMVERIRQLDASCRNVDEYPDAYRAPYVLERRRIGTHLIGGHNYGRSVL